MWGVLDGRALWRGSRDGSGAGASSGEQERLEGRDPERRRKGRREKDLAAPS